MGYGGNYICPLTHGEQELMQLEMHTENYWKWIHLIILSSVTLFLLAVNYYAFAFVYFPERKVIKELDHFIRANLINDSEIGNTT